MYLQIESYRGEDWLFDTQISVSDDLNKKLHRLFKKPTMVFMPHYIYNELNPKVRDSLTLAYGDDDDMTVEQMLKTDVLTVLTDEQFEPYADMMLFVDNVTHRENEYLVIEDIV